MHSCLRTSYCLPEVTISSACFAPGNNFEHLRKLCWFLRQFPIVPSPRFRFDPAMKLTVPITPLRCSMSKCLFWWDRLRLKWMRLVPKFAQSTGVKGDRDASGFNSACMLLSDLSMGCIIKLFECIRDYWLNSRYFICGPGKFILYAIRKNIIENVRITKIGL